MRSVLTDFSSETKFLIFLPGCSSCWSLSDEVYSSLESLQGYKVSKNSEKTSKNMFPSQVLESHGRLGKVPRWLNCLHRCSARPARPLHLHLCSAGHAGPSLSLPRSSFNLTILILSCSVANLVLKHLGLPLMTSSRPASPSSRYHWGQFRTLAWNNLRWNAWKN